MSTIIIKSEAILKVATNESMWDRRNVKINAGSPAVLDKTYRIKPYLNESGAQTSGFDGKEAEKYMPQIIGVEPNSPDFSKRCMQYWQSIHHKFDSNGLLLDLSFAVEEEHVEAFNKCKEDDKYKYGNPVNMLHYIIYRYCLNWVCVANSYNIYKAKRHAKQIEFYFYTEDEVKAAEVNRVTFANKVMTSYIKAIESPELTEGILRYFELGKTAHDVTENIGKNFSYDNLNTADIGGLMYHIQQTVPAKFVELVEDPNLAWRIFVYRCTSVNVLNIPHGSTSVYAGDMLIGQSMIEAIRKISSDGELKLELENKLAAIKKKA